VVTIENREVMDRVRKIIEKAFDSKAEAYSRIELAKYFKRRELLPRLIHQREHHVLRGRKGTGKTAILLYLSLPVQIHCIDKTDVDFTGFYLTFGANIPPQVSFDPDTEREIALLFGHWFNLYVCKVIIDSILTATSDGFRGIDKQGEKRYVTELWTSFFRISDSIPSSLQQASSALDSFQKELRRFLSEPSFNKTNSHSVYLSKSSRYKGIVTDVANFKEIIEIMQRTLQIFENKMVFILMDEYDNLSPSQQLVVNTAIAASTGQYYAKVGVLSEQGIKDRSTLTGLTLRDDQLKFVDLEEFANNKEFEDFARAAIGARLEEIREKVSETPELTKLFDDLDKLMPTKSPSEQLREQKIEVLQRKHSGQLSLLDTYTQYPDHPQLGDDVTDGMDMDGWWTLIKNGRLPTYCGIGTICLLSSGLIRSAI